MLDTIRTKWKLKGLIRLWLAYREAVHRALKMEIPTGEQEARFLTLKAHIASRLHFLAEAVPATLDANARKPVSAMLTMLKQHRALLVMEPQGTLTSDAFDREWHDHYIYLNNLRGMPLAKPGGRRKHAGVPTGMKRRFGLVSPGKRALGFVWRLALLALLVYVVGLAIGVQRVEGSFAVTFPESPGAALENVLNGVSLLWSGAFPAVVAYGPVAAVIAGVIVLATLGYRALARG